MSIENLLNPIAEQADQDDIIPITTDENLAFNVSNMIITTESQDQSEVDQDDDDEITKADKITLTLKEVTTPCNQIHYSLLRRPDSAKDPNWNSHLKALLKVKNDLHLSQEANKAQKTQIDFYFICA
ncbi:hypothetical protein O181_034026 [Austropuccinia psidii MF-1]|uniref:Uncharacterized protein n=1 Tax=Austropuccinia psidii MF-1 TaxID=1389203 RepID=A0A9Q3CZV8_9BASI|nr:hypothetical protein [Austropuccinia psidii MF-1]